jgi:hypothetical protein
MKTTQPATRNPQPATRNPQPATRNPQPATRNPQPAPRNPQPATRNPQPYSPSIVHRVNHLLVIYKILYYNEKIFCSELSIYIQKCFVLVLLAASAFLTGCPQPTDADGDKRTGTSIANTFGTTDVTDTFNAVHNYLSGKTPDQLASDKIIQLGDYIDLPSLTVGEATVVDKELPGHGRLLRLIVVGINSFNAKSIGVPCSYEGGDNDLCGEKPHCDPHKTYTIYKNKIPYTYEYCKDEPHWTLYHKCSITGDYKDKCIYGGNGNSPIAHLVFQFQNVAFKRQMEASNTNVNGYAGSAMRAYILNDFLTGLQNAGVPDYALWGPARYMAKFGAINDKLWLPTVREMFATNNTMADDSAESAKNQTLLEYYNGTNSRIKYNADNSPIWYRLASPNSTSTGYFCNVTFGGYSSYGNASIVGGVAPAFCIK